MQRGTIKNSVSQRGFGFLAPDDGGPDLFFHVSQLRSGREPVAGDAVSYEAGTNERNGKPCATSVTVRA